MVSGYAYLSVPSRLINFDKCSERAYCACSRFWWNLFGYFFLAPTVSLFPPPTLWDGWMNDVILRLFQ